jgi:hypothetical protein
MLKTAEAPKGIFGLVMNIAALTYQTLHRCFQRGAVGAFVYHPTIRKTA